MMKHGILLIGVVLAAAASSSSALATKGTLSASESCGACHKEIYRMWQKSAHAGCADNQTFLEAYRDTKANEGEDVARVCLRCHAPATEINRDYALEQRVTAEGVGCDICHSLVSVEPSPAGARQVYDVGSIKRGPIPDAVSSAHEIGYSELHKEALVCAGCHEYVNREGTAIMTTYSEWKGSLAAAQGRSCQECHMARTKGDVVDPKIARVAHAEVNVHVMPGGHSLDQLHKALRVAIDGKRDGDTLGVEISLINRGAGHAVPTGMPGRRVILDLHVRTSGGGTFTERRVYERSLLDANGAPIQRDSGHFAKGVRLGSDTRIQADERRVESFRWSVPGSATAYLTLKLHYEHAPMGGEEDRTYIAFLSEERVLVPAEPAGH